MSQNPFSCALMATESTSVFIYSSHRPILWFWDSRGYFVTTLTDWRSGKIRRWGEDCTGECIECSVPGENAAMFNVHFTDSATESDFPDLSLVPSCYHHLREVFNKKKAMSLPPHQPYNCAIELLPGSNIPKVCLYSVSGPEKEAMTEYIGRFDSPFIISCRGGVFLHGQEGRLPKTVHWL